MSKRDTFRYFRASREIIWPMVRMNVSFPLSSRNVQNLLHERGIELSYETLSFDPISGSEIRWQRAGQGRSSC